MDTRTPFGSLLGTNLCLGHQGNHAHYSKENCRICTLALAAAIDAALAEKDDHDQE